MNLTDAPGRYKRAGKLYTRTIAAGRSIRMLNPGAFDCLQHHARLLHVYGQWLITEHMATKLRRSQRYLTMRAARGRNRDDVGEEFFERVTPVEADFFDPKLRR